MKTLGRRWGSRRFSPAQTSIIAQPASEGNGAYPPTEGVAGTGRAVLFDGALGLRISTDIPYFGIGILTAFHPIDA